MAGICVVMAVAVGEGGGAAFVAVFVFAVRVIPPVAVGFRGTGDVGRYMGSPIRWRIGMDAL
jgi:hypothetical protein